MSDKDSQENLGKLQMMEHNMAALEQQRQQLQSQLFEIESAMTALDGAKEAYRIVGSVMVKATPSDVLTDLKNKKELPDVRIQSVEKQEAKMRDSAKALQDQVMNALKK